MSGRDAGGALLHEVPTRGLFASSSQLTLLDHFRIRYEEQIRRAYASFLDHYAGDATAWRALPRDVSAWWRRRAQSWLEHDGDGWRIAGPAADEGSVEFVGGTW